MVSMGWILAGEMKPRVYLKHYAKNWGSLRSETVILDALRDLDIRRQSNESLLWYQWTAVLPYQRRLLLDALGVPIDRGFIWDPSG